MTTNPNPAPTAAWVDGDPLMEAIAAAVWEQCGRSDSGSCVEDDPRTIAAVAAAVSVPPSAPRADDQAALRDRIAEALLRWAERGNDPQYASMRRPETVRANAYSRADAVLAVLPAPVDRAAVLREAADALPEADLPFVPPMDRRRVADWLRRMADEAAVPGPCVAGEQQNETRHVCTPGASTYHCPTSGQTESDCHGGFTTCCDRPDLHHAPAVVAQPGKETAAAEPPRVMQCTRAILRRPHESHGWYPQPGMDPVDCPGHGSTEAPE